MFVFIQKQYPENLAFLILTVLELFTRESRLSLTYSIVFECKQIFHASHVLIPQKVKCVSM